MNRHSPVRLTGLSASMVLGCGLLMTPTVNAMIDEDLYAFNDEIELSDEELSGLRGRYIGGNQITYFGVEMYSKVANTSGGTTTAGLAFSTDISSTEIRPTLTVFHSSTAGDGSAGNVGTGLARITSSGLDNIKGVRQSIQVAGDLNDISNDLAIDISSDVNEAGSRFTDMEISFSLDGPGSRSVSGDAGTSTTFSLDKSGFGYTVALPGAGVEVSQNVRNAAQNQANGISQHVQVGSDQYRVNNVINIVARHQNVANGFQRPELNSALTSLRGLQSFGRL